MKNIYLILIAVFVAFSCEQEEFEGSGLESLRDFELNPVSGARIELNSLAPDEEVVIGWNEARSGFNSTVKYTWLVAKVDGDFNSPLLSVPSDNDGTATNVSLTNGELDQVLVDLGLAVGQEIDLKWTVSATNGDLTKMASPNTITIKRFVGEIAPFGSQTPDKLLIALTDPADELTVSWDSTFFSFGGEVNYQWIVDTTGGDFSNPLLTIDANDNSTIVSHQSFFDLFADLGASEGEIVSLQWKVVAITGDKTKDSEGVYTIVLADPVGASKFMVGAATPGGWGWDNPTEMYQVSTGVWMASLYFTNDSFRFFNTEGDWGSGTNYPYYLNEGYTIDADFEDALDGDNNFRFAGTPGNYLITLDTNSKTITLE